MISMDGDVSVPMASQRAFSARAAVASQGRGEPSASPTMGRRPSRRLPKPDRRRALELLASCPEGCTEAILRAHGFTIEQMVETRPDLRRAA